MPSLSEIIEVIKLPLKTMITLGIVLGFLLFAKDIWLENLGVAEIVAAYKSFISLGFLFFVVASVVEIVHKILKIAEPYFKWFWFQISGKAYLKSLSAEEKTILKQAIKEDSKFVSISVLDGKAKVFEAYKIIARVTNGYYAHNPSYEYYILPWVWKYLKTHHEILE